MKLLVALSAAAAFMPAAMADCPVDGPIGANSKWAGEMSIVNQNTFKVKGYTVKSDVDFHWWGLKPDGTNERIFDVEQTPSGLNDDTDNMWEAGVAQDAVFTLIAGKAIADYKEIQMWCERHGNTYGVGRYNPSDLILTETSCMVDPNATATTNSPTNDSAGSNIVPATVAGVVSAALALSAYF